MGRLSICQTTPHAFEVLGKMTSPDRHAIGKNNQLHSAKFEKKKTRVEILEAEESHSSSGGNWQQGNSIVCWDL
ncbi:hypothetical protein CEXT_323741 [Caerostris extrusa]|uniref:Uncharacterized protein n=1 Tax=Caerostris extrusa TaxID=172846 RepID=A0AAV4NI09_CAEEX|nr:hypothetical protein CEXT_323741 [Caerostris extrusa]